MRHFSDLTAGQKIRIIKSFKDFDNKEIKEGRLLTFSDYDLFVYDGGYTLKFEEGSIRLAEVIPENDYILTHPLEFFEIVFP